MPFEVSVVIPTRNRPELVCRAVRSALNQTFRNLEVIVVIDGPDPATEDALQQIGDSRLRVIPLRENVGGCEARNVGARAAHGEYVALLDDDDEWLPVKIERQVQLAGSLSGSHKLVTTLFLDRRGSTDLVRPRRYPKAGQPISEYLWCEVSWLGGIEGFPQTSTWLVSRTLLLDVPFTPGQKVLQDLDWLLHAFSRPELQTAIVNEPLSIFHNDSGRDRVTKKIDWRYSRDWALNNRHLFTPKALGFFLVTYCVNPAARQHESWRNIMLLLQQCFRYGQVNVKLLCLFTLYSCVYPSLTGKLSLKQRQTLLYRVTSALKRPA